jgi:Ca-activated chloride channel family protein
MVEVNQRGLDILIGIDTSRSMLAEDAGPGISRLQRAKLAALDLAKLAKTDRVGLVAFAGSAFLQCPLTIDDEAFRQSVEALDTGIIPQGGTAIGPAIHTALERLRRGT